jgi:hypothetical protein
MDLETNQNVSRKLVSVPHWLNEAFQERRFDRKGAVVWVPRSTELSLLYFIFWDYVKSYVYTVKINNLANREQRTEGVCKSINTDILRMIQNSMLFHLQTRLEADSGLF